MILIGKYRQDAAPYFAWQVLVCAKKWRPRGWRTVKLKATDEYHIYPHFFLFFFNHYPPDAECKSSYKYAFLNKFFSATLNKSSVQRVGDAYTLYPSVGLDSSTFLTHLWPCVQHMWPAHFHFLLTPWAYRSDSSPDFCDPKSISKRDAQHTLFHNSGWLFFLTSLQTVKILLLDAKFHS